MQPQLFAPLMVVLVALMVLLFLAIPNTPTPNTPTDVGLAHLLVVFFLYWLAFTAVNQTGWPTPWALLAVRYAALIYWLIAPNLAELWGAVVTFLVLLAGMLWAAVGMGVQTGQPWALLGLAGALLLVNAASVLALHTWRTPIIDKSDKYCTYRRCGF